jgi:hypothetical protein
MRIFNANGSIVWANRLRAEFPHARYAKASWWANSGKVNRAPTSGARGDDNASLPAHLEPCEMVMG